MPVSPYAHDGIMEVRIIAVISNMLTCRLKPLLLLIFSPFSFGAFILSKNNTIPPPDEFRLLQLLTERDILNNNKSTCRF